MARKPLDPALKRQRVQSYVRPEDFEWMQSRVGDEPGKRWKSPSDFIDDMMRLGRLYDERLEAVEAGVVEELVRQKS